MRNLTQLLAARCVQAVLVALVIGAVSFAMMQSLPGDAAFRIAAGRYGYDIMDATAAASVRAELGLDRSLPLQFWSWMTQLANGDLGRSLVTGNPVWEELAPQLAASMALAGVAIIFSLVIAVPIGTVAGLWPGGIFDQATLLLSAGLRSVPAFALGVVLMLALAVEARVLPVAGYGEARHFVLPSLALGLSLASVSNRVIRDAVVACSGSAWYAFARTKGLSRPDVLVRHVARNAAVPTLAYVGVQLALLIEGVVIIESVFAWPGIGHALVHAIFERDLPMVQGTALVLGLTFVILSFTVDLACRALDPRGSPAA